MTDLRQWQESNARYLSTALAWLRARLERCAEHGPGFASAAGAPPGPPEQESGSRLKPVRGQAIERVTKPSALLPAHGKGRRDPVAQAAAAMASPAKRMDPPPALILLAQCLGLSQFEQEILLLCAAMELDTGVASLCARAQGAPDRPYPTFALALTLFDEPAWDALSPERGLRYWRLIEIHQPSGHPLTTSALRADEKIVNYIKGLNYLDDRLATLVTPLDVPTGGAELPPSQQSTAETILRHLKPTPPSQNPPVIQLLGADSASKQLVAAHAASALELRIYQLPVAVLPGQAADLETFARLWRRDSLLLPIALYLDAPSSEIDAPQAGQASPVNRLLARLRGFVFLDTRDFWRDLPHASVPVDVATPTPAEQQLAWAASLGKTAGNTPAVLAGQFNLGVPSIRHIARQVLSERKLQKRPLHDPLWDACLASTRPRLDILAQRLEPKATWDDIVLPEAEHNLLRQIAAQVAQRSQVYHAWGFGQKMSRGFGISALFTGDSGTGKTMAAEVIANELRLNLYRIDLSAVVSKYIGETEKNLRRLFEVAEVGGALLFFDEADALFGKRSEVKDSHDRYANIEINYLLQRMEAYRGLAILATNMKSALDPAFMRRLRFVVSFPFPGVTERKEIWRKVFPPQTPVAELDFERLARLNLTGGNIHSIALNAAFLAAQARTKVTTPLVLDAARTELRKLGRVINELEFRVVAAPVVAPAFRPGRARAKTVA